MLHAAPTMDRVERLLGSFGREARRRRRAFRVVRIGHSREGRPILGVHAGRGETRVSITAGAHSDEPAGPLAALRLIEDLAMGRLERHFPKVEWFICPHVNPDGAARNARWFRRTPDFEEYSRDAFREPPGDDVEFNYPVVGGVARPENEAVAGFLRRGAPFRLHLSLHGMAAASGAWWLIGEDWAPRSGELRGRLAELFRETGFGLHDVDRRGEKGFRRIEPGFSTTPTSTEMRKFFMDRSEEVTAERFLPSSMEFVQSLGGDPLVMVSELPMFLLKPAGDRVGEDLGQTSPGKFRAEWEEARKTLREGSVQGLHDLAARYRINPVPWAVQVETLRQAVLLSVAFVEGWYSRMEIR